MLVQGLLRLCPGETFHESCAQTAGDLPVAFMKSFDCKIPIQVRAVLAGCTVHDIGPEAIPGFLFFAEYKPDRADRQSLRKTLTFQPLQDKII